MMRRRQGSTPITEIRRSGSPAVQPCLIMQTQAVQDDGGVSVMQHVAKIEYLDASSSLQRPRVDIFSSNPHNDN